MLEGTQGMGWKEGTGGVGDWKWGAQKLVVWDRSNEEGFI